MEVIEMASCEHLLLVSIDMGPLSNIENGSGDDAGTTEKFLNPIWGGDPSADESDRPFALVNAKIPLTHRVRSGSTPLRSAMCSFWARR